MSDSKISALPPAATLTGAELIPVVQSGNSVRSTVSAVQNNALGTYTPTGIGAVPTTVAGKLGQMVSVVDFGADRAGLLDSSAAFTAAFATGANFVYVPPANPGVKYIVHDVTIPNGVTLFAYGAYFVDQPGAQWMFKLVGFGTKLLGAYVSSALNCAQAVVIVENSNQCVVTDVQIYNCVNAFKTQATGGQPGAMVFWMNCYANTFTGVGFYIGPNCAGTRAVNLFLDAGMVAGTGGLIPRAGSIGVQIVSTGSTLAPGGHNFVSCQVQNTQDGFLAIDGQLLMFCECIADNHSGRGFAFTGNTGTGGNIIMTGCFTGPAAYGVSVEGTINSVWLTGLTTINNGIIIAGYGSNFYTSGGYAGPYFDINVANTARVTVDADTWLANQGTAHAYQVAAGAQCNVTGGERLNITSTGIAAATTTYLGPAGANTNPNYASWVCPFACVINSQNLTIFIDTAPGAAQSFTYTLYVNGAATGITATISGAGSFAATFSGSQVGIAKGQNVTLQLVTSAGAATSGHRGYMQLIPQP